ncbi:hypothetical protein D3C72_2062480 [compost metagenome]
MHFAFADEDLIDLECVDRNFIEIPERGEARTEIIQRYSYAKTAKLGQLGDRLLHIVHGDGFGDLQLQEMRRQSRTR